MTDVFKNIFNTPSPCKIITLVQRRKTRNADYNNSLYLTKFQAKTQKPVHLELFGLEILPETHFFNVIYKVIKTDKKGAIEFNCLGDVFNKIQEKVGLEFSKKEAEYIGLRSKKRELQPKLLFEFIVFHYIKKELKRLGVSNSFRWIEKTPNHAYYLDKILSF